MNIIILQHTKIEDPGYIKDLMLADRFNLTTIELDEGERIPKDLSKVQSANALNIINQLRQKNAFPGDTATDREASNESVD